ncbi:flagellar assembly protein FliX [Roseomonas sp. BN140053]|uniref:flagellar assembly protein FliX n=1 Tax=Roseomonas sp. BN140053 TaxID=3391898 RepID=UPI0039EBC1CE
MQRVGDIRPAFSGVPSRRPGASGGFRLPGGTEETGSSATVTAASPLGLLAVQEEPDDPRARNRRAARRATALLDELAGLQAEMLGGRPDPARLERLAALAEGEGAIDPALAEVLEGVALRARIEAARYK